MDKDFQDILRQLKLNTERLRDIEKRMNNIESLVNTSYPTPEDLGLSNEI